MAKEAAKYLISLIAKNIGISLVNVAPDSQAVLFHRSFYWKDLMQSASATHANR